MLEDTFSKETALDGPSLGTVQLREGLLAALVGEAAERDTAPSCVPVM